jgi:hypothetical protein
MTKHQKSLTHTPMAYRQELWEFSIPVIKDVWQDGPRTNPFKILPTYDVNELL